MRSAITRRSTAWPMDGIAVDSEALRRGQRRFRIQGTQGAGAPALKLKGVEEAIEVMTGAILPVGCDNVIPVEQLDVIDGIASLNVDVVNSPYHNVHRRGSDGRQGLLLLESGTLLRPPEIAVAASAGMARVRVSSQPAVMVVSTGDELIEPGEPIAEFQVRRSNAYAVAATLRKRGFARVGDDHVSDNEQHLRERLALHLTTHEVVVLSGGVSMGKFDLVPKVLVQPRRSRGLSQSRTKARPADVVRDRRSGTGGVRLAGQSGVHSGLSDSLRHPRDCRGHGHQAPYARTLGAGLPGHLQATARLLLARCHRT